MNESYKAIQAGSTGYYIVSSRILAYAAAYYPNRDPMVLAVRRKSSRNAFNSIYFPRPDGTYENATGGVVDGPKHDTLSDTHQALKDRYGLGCYAVSTFSGADALYE